MVAWTTLTRPLPRCPPPADKPDGLLAELHEAQALLVFAEYHIRLWCANSVTGHTSLRPRLSYAAHEALYDAGKIIANIAELLRIHANGTLPTPQGNAAQIYVRASQTDGARCEPASQFSVEGS